MDSDDISVNDRFEKQIKEFEKDKSLSIVGGHIYEFIDKQDNLIGMRSVPLNNTEIYRYLKYRCPFNHQTVMFKKKDVIQVGNYIELHYNEDYYLWIRMALNNLKFKNIDANLVYVRVGKELYKRRGGWKYFKSEYQLQKYMIEKNIISKPQFILNVIKRFVLQVLLPNSCRQYVFKIFARKKVGKKNV